MRNARPRAQTLHLGTSRHHGQCPWTCEFLLNEKRNGEWAFRRNEAVRRPLQEVGDERDGVPFLRPEIGLLYKAAEPSPKNDTDFFLVQPHLSREASLWLLAALESCDDRHPWIDRLRADRA